METVIETALVARRRTVARWTWRAVLVVVLVLVVWFILLPQFAQVEPALQSLGHVSSTLLLIGLGLELASIACYSLLTRATLNRAGRPNYFTLLRIDVATQGVNNAVPGGGPTSTALKYRLLTVARTDPANAVTGTTFEISTSVLTLGLIFGLAMVSVMPNVHGNPEYLIAGIVVVGVAILVIAAIILLGKSRTHTLAIVERVARRVPFLREDTAVSFVGMLSDQVHHHRSSPRRLVVAVLLAAANWMLDIAALWVMLLAFGHSTDPRTLLVAYGLASLVGLLPITPGGLGIIEGVLIPALVGFGTPQGIAILGVLTWRLVQYWLPMPLAAAAYLSLRTTKRWRGSRDVTPREHVSV
ncbi:MAG TPA: YbhN family protein [Galbitalea sp.]|nr:YbhN family protein [Galbitalea sp.]